MNKRVSLLDSLIEELDNNKVSRLQFYILLLIVFGAWLYFLIYLTGGWILFFYAIVILYAILKG